MIPLSPFILPWLIYHHFCKIRLVRQVKEQWLGKGIRGIFVYSDGPHWKEYIETNILPKIGSKLVILNWSKRSTWNNDLLEVKVYKRWGNVGRILVNKKLQWFGGKEHNPIAVVFQSNEEPKVIKFWNAFKEFKRGKDDTLKKQMALLFELL